MQQIFKITLRNIFGKLCRILKSALNSVQQIFNLKNRWKFCSLAKKQKKGSAILHRFVYSTIQTGILYADFNNLWSFVKKSSRHKFENLLHIKRSHRRESSWTANDHLRYPLCSGTTYAISTLIYVHVTQITWAFLVSVRSVSVWYRYRTRKRGISRNIRITASVLFRPSSRGYELVASKKKWFDASLKNEKIIKNWC